MVYTLVYMPLLPTYPGICTLPTHPVYAPPIHPGYTSILPVHTPL